MSKKSILITPLHFTVSAIIQIHLLVVLKFYMSHLLSNYKYFSKMYILVRVIALLFHCAPSVWRARSKWSLWSLAENQQNGNISNVYRWRIYLWNVSYALGKTARLKHIKQHLCQRHTQPFCQSIWQGECEPLYTETLNYRLLYLTSFFLKPLIKLVTCLEQIVLCTFSAEVQSVSSLDIFFRCALSNYCISILTVLLHISLIKNISICCTNSIYRPAQA